MSFIYLGLGLFFTIVTIALAYKGLSLIVELYREYAYGTPKQAKSCFFACCIVWILELIVFGIALEFYIAAFIGGGA